MTLDEAIEHCIQKTKELGCSECGKEHMQLAVWLQELEIRRKKNIKNVNQYKIMESLLLAVCSEELNASREENIKNMNWNKITEKLPDNSRSVLVVISDNGVESHWKYDIGQFENGFWFIRGQMDVLKKTEKVVLWCEISKPDLDLI